LTFDDAAEKVRDGENGHSQVAINRPGQGARWTTASEGRVLTLPTRSGPFELRTRRPKAAAQPPAVDTSGCVYHYDRPNSHGPRIGQRMNHNGRVGARLNPFVPGW